MIEFATITFVFNTERGEKSSRLLLWAQGRGNHGLLHAGIQNTTDASALSILVHVSELIADGTLHVIWPTKYMQRAAVLEQSGGLVCASIYGAAGPGASITNVKIVTYSYGVTLDRDQVETHMTAVLDNFNVGEPLAYVGVRPFDVLEKACGEDDVVDLRWTQRTEGGAAFLRWLLPQIST